MQDTNESHTFTSDIKNSAKKESTMNSSDKLSNFETKEQPLRIWEKFKFSVKKNNTGKWSKEEHQNFLDACKNHGNNWFKVKFYYRNLDSGRIEDKNFSSNQITCTEVHNQALQKISNQN